jgi:hypothetical protein
VKADIPALNHAHSQGLQQPQEDILSIYIKDNSTHTLSRRISMEMMMTLFGGYMVMSFFSFSQFDADADPTRLASSYYCLYIT